jgi:hypothetical protein
LPVSFLLPKRLGCQGWALKLLPPPHLFLLAASFFACPVSLSWPNALGAKFDGRDDDDDD